MAQEAKTAARPAQPPTPEQAAENYKGIFPGIDGHFHFRALTAEQLQSLDRSYDSAITFVAHMFAAERYDIIDDIKPVPMDRKEFMHVILRESQRRNILERVLNSTGFVPRDAINNDITVTRPRDVPAEQQRSVSMRSGDVAFRDVAIDMLLDPLRSNFLLKPEVAAQVGLPKGETNGIIIENDTQAVMLGYMMGANPNLFPENNPVLAAGKLPLTISFKPEPKDLIRPYCSAVDNIANPGRDVDQAVAVSTGFIMSRTDAVNGTSNNVELGFNGFSCKDVGNNPWNDSMRIALSGFDRNGAQAQQQLQR